MRKGVKKTTYELEVKNASFVKYIGYSDSDNMVFVQDSVCTNYYFTASELKLIRQSADQEKVVDVCGSSEYILQATEEKKVLILSRSSLSLLRTINTGE